MNYPASRGGVSDPELRNKKEKNLGHITPVEALKNSPLSGSLPEKYSVMNQCNAC
jgi:hypothetical protein